MCSPVVSVNMSVYNAEAYVAGAIDSILGQTFGKFELVIVDDGSNDGTGRILASFDDSRIRVISQDNHGISCARNRALRESRGQFVAVMDADDVSLPLRLERQVTFLDTHPDVGLVGTAAKFVDELRGREWYYRPPTSDRCLRTHLVRGNPFVHTSVMMRRSDLEAVGGYNEAYPYIVDHELFVRLALHTQLANLPEVLVVHHHRLGSVSVTLDTELLRLWLRLRVHYRAFRSGNYPAHYFWYVIQPVLFFVREFSPKLPSYVKQMLHTSWGRRPE
jgi:glycosyltransferase involved in cell wall biosynthesis